MKCMAEPLDGPTTERMRALAKELGIHLLAPILYGNGGEVENTAVLIDDEGEIVGTYSKPAGAGDENLFSAETGIRVSGEAGQNRRADLLRCVFPGDQPPAGA